MKKLLLFIALCLGACKTVELKVTPVNAATRTDGSEPGIIYSLPKKDYYLELKVERTSFTPGKLYDTCAYKKIQKLLIGNPITRSRESFEILSASLQNYVVPDDTKQYFIAITNTNKRFVDGKLNFDFTESGLLKSSSLESENKGLEFGIKAGSAIINAAVGVAAFLAKVPAPMFKNASKIDSVNNIWNKEDCRSDTVLKRLENIQRIKRELLSCKICEKQNVKEMWTLLSAEEKRLIEFLVGAKQSDTLIYRIPLSNLISAARLGQPNMPLFTLTSSGNLVLAGSYVNGAIPAGETVYGKISSYNLNTGSQLSTITDYRTGANTSGLRYNLPSVCKIEIHDGSTPAKIKIEVIETIPQLGKVVALSSKIGGHKNSQSFTLDTKTGALIQYNVTTSAPDKSTFDPLIDQINKLPEHTKALSKTQREVENLKIQTEYLKALKEYREQLNPPASE